MHSHSIKFNDEQERGVTRAREAYNEALPKAFQAAGDVAEGEQPQELPVDQREGYLATNTAYLQHVSGPWADSYAKQYPEEA